MQQNNVTDQELLFVGEYLGVGRGMERLEFDTVEQRRLPGASSHY